MIKKVKSITALTMVLSGMMFFNGEKVDAAQGTCEARYCLADGTCPADCQYIEGVRPQDGTGIKNRKFSNNRQQNHRKGAGKGLRDGSCTK